MAVGRDYNDIGIKLSCHACQYLKPSPAEPVIVTQ